MSSYRSEVQNLRYNAATRCFEALVVMTEDAGVMKYPTALPLPIDSDFSFVAKKLVADAKRQRHQSAGHLVCRTVSGKTRLAHLGDLARHMTRGLGHPTQRVA